MKKLLVLGLLLWAPWVNAEERPEDVTALNLSATARQIVTPDMLHAQLEIVSKAKEPEDVQNDINKKMKKGLKEAEKYEHVKIATGHYNVYERWIHEGEKKEDREKMWQGSQSVELKSTDQTEVLKAAQKLQEAGFVMKGLSYSLSRPVQDSFEEALMAEALDKIQARAHRFAKQLGKENVHMTQINMNAQGGAGRPIMARMLKSQAFDAVAEMAAPVARAGEMELTATVNAVVWLK